MKNLVVYYSRSGNTEVIAQEISNIINGDLKRIELIKQMGFGWSAFSSLIGLKGKIRSLDFNVNDYDNVFIGGQVWAGKSSTPINTFIHQTDFTNKNVFVFLTLADSKEPSDVFKSISKRIENKGGRVIDTFYIQTVMNSLISNEKVYPPVSDWITKNIDLVKGI